MRSSEVQNEQQKIEEQSEQAKTPPPATDATAFVVGAVIGGESTPSAPMAGVPKVVERG